jgi:general secretion pathway protein G
MRMGRWLQRRRLTFSSQRGVSLVELVAVSAILVVLASITLPVANTMVKRRKEIELRQALREIRRALDQFQLDSERFPGIRQLHLDAVNEEGYPQELEWLVEGVDIGDGSGTKIKYLRRLPVDPMTGKDEWDTRSSRDPPDALFSDGVNIFDVRSKSEKISLDGETRYNEW